jgi:hypothetical protein
MRSVYRRRLGALFPLSKHDTERFLKVGKGVGGRSGGREWMDTKQT